MTWAKKCCVWRKPYCVLILGATLIGAGIRLPRLAERPMHGDEAIHAMKFGQLLEEGIYTYDPTDYHGPLLTYLTLVPAWLSAASKLTEVTEFTLRIVPVFFGVLLILLPLLVLDGLGRTAGVCAAVLTVVSPAMVFYSRYYIMEILLIFFTFGAIVCGYRYIQSKKFVWALLGGIFLGLMHATKETCIIAFGSMLLAILLVMSFESLVFSYSKFKTQNSFKGIKLWHLIFGLAAAVGISALFYSSFFTYPKGIPDSFRAYANYFSQAGSDPLHIHPWYYYLNMLIYFRIGNGPVWSEALIVFLAIAGFAAVSPATCGRGIKKPPAQVRGLKSECPSLGSPFTSDKSQATGDGSAANGGLLKFIAFYTMVMTVTYSAIGYKTPWCMLGFFHGMILLAGIGAAAILRLVPNALARTIVILLLAAGGAHLAWEAYLTNYVYYADSRNPYVYAHPTTEVFTVVRRVEQIAQANPDGRAIHIQVISPGNDYWPLPWYFRAFTKIGWYENIPDNVPPAPVIIASDNMETEITEWLYNKTPFEKRQMYQYLFDNPYYVWLRPKVKLIGLVRRDFWEQTQRLAPPPVGGV